MRKGVSSYIALAALAAGLLAGCGSDDQTAESSGTPKEELLCYLMGEAEPEGLNVVVTAAALIDSTDPLEVLYTVELFEDAARNACPEFEEWATWDSEA